MKLFQKLSFIAIIALIFTSCGNSKQRSSNSANRKKITIAFVNWSECIANTHLAKVALEAHGYQVDLINADVAPVFEAVANGDADVFMELWEPVTHKPYMDKFGDKVEQLGTIYKDGRLALVVPEYVTIDSINQLNKYKDKFGGKIIGINPGAGIMRITNQVIKDYGLNYQLITSSEAGMLAALKKAYDQKEWIVTTGWKPHTMFAKWNLKILKDPKKVMGDAETISIIATKGWAAKNPVAAAFFSNFKMNDDLLGTLMFQVEAAPGKEDEAAKKWYEAHEKLVDGWFRKQAN